jgi:hypothetical protein
VQVVKQISAIILGMIFLISSSGFLIYKSYCFCTGNQQVSVFVQNDICETNSMISCRDESDESLSSCCLLEESQACESHLSNCDCDKPEVLYVKLANNVVKEEVRFTKTVPVLMVKAIITSQFRLEKADVLNESGFTSIDPPPVYDSCLEFLIHIQQLKISLIA